MPVFSRLGPYDRSRLDRIAGHGNGTVDRRLVEYWAHEASLIPVELHPLFRWRMADVDREAWGSISRIAREQPDLVAETLELVAENGPIRARDTGAVRPPPRPGHMWNWHEGKVALEYLFFTGQVAAAAAGQLRAAVRHDRSGAPGRRTRAADAGSGGRAARAGADRRAGARRRHRAGPRRLLPAAARRLEGARRRARGGRRAARGRGRGLVGARVPVAGRRAGRAGCTPVRCCRRSTR